MTKTTDSRLACDGYFPDTLLQVAQKYGIIRFRFKWKTSDANCKTASSREGRMRNYTIKQHHPGPDLDKNTDAEEAVILSGGRGTGREDAEL